MPKPTDATALMCGDDEKVGLFLARHFDQTDVGPAQARVGSYAEINLPQHCFGALAQFTLQDGLNLRRILPLKCVPSEAKT